MDNKMFFGLQGKEIVCSGDYTICLEYDAKQGNVDSVVHRRNAFIHEWR